MRVVSGTQRKATNKLIINTNKNKREVNSSSAAPTRSSCRIDHFRFLGSTRIYADDHRISKHPQGFSQNGARTPCRRWFPKSHSRRAQMETARSTWRSRALVSHVRTLVTSDQRLRRRPGSAIACEAMPRAVGAAL